MHVGCHAALRHAWVASCVPQLAPKQPECSSIACLRCTDGDAVLPPPTVAARYDVQADFGAKGDGEADDTAALQVGLRLFTNRLCSVNEGGGRTVCVARTHRACLLNSPHAAHRPQLRQPLFTALLRLLRG